MLPFMRLIKRKARYKGPDGGLFGDWGTVQTRSLRAERMTVSVNAPVADDAWCGSDAMASLGMERNPRSGRQASVRQPILSEDTAPRAPAVSSSGLRKGVAMVTIAGMCFVLGVLTLVQVSELAEAGKSVSNLESQIEDVQRVNEELERSLAISSSELNVSYEAAKRGMMSAKGVNVIYLTAPQGMALPDAETANASGQAGQFATILGD